MAEGVLFMISGALIALNRCKLGGFILLVAMAFVLATKDNPFI
jgi:hypothetical protein